MENYAKSGTAYLDSYCHFVFDISENLTKPVV